jgi:hypothetical protein
VEGERRVAAVAAGDAPIQAAAAQAQLSPDLAGTVQADELARLLQRQVLAGVAEAGEVSSSQYPPAIVGAACRLAPAGNTTTATAATNPSSSTYASAIRRPDRLPVPRLSPMTV